MLQEGAGTMLQEGAGTMCPEGGILCPEGVIYKSPVISFYNWLRAG